MKKLTIACCAILLAGCVSSHRDDDSTIVAAPPSQTAPDVELRLAQMQTSMTELLERIDVLNDRIARLESAVAAGASRPTLSRPAEKSSVGAERSAASAPLASARIADTYRGALNLFAHGKIVEARRTFQQVFDDDPAGDLADNALFWIGETYFQAGDFANAERYYRRVTIEFAEQNKAPDALFKIALTQEKTGDLALARRTLEEVIQKYPYSSSAASAKFELKRIKY